MRGPLLLPESWKSTKYVSWPRSHSNPIVRIPRPVGEPESRTVQRLLSEFDTLKRCIDYRNTRGIEIWGEKRWAELLKVAARSVAKHRDVPSGPLTGVNHFERPNGTTLWVANWYELLPDGARKKKSKQYSYGTPLSKFATSEQAMNAAVEKRLLEESRWYSVRGVRNKRKVSKL